MNKIESAIIYCLIVSAALDAYCLIEVHDVICAESERQGVPLKEVTDGLLAGRSPYRSRPPTKPAPTIKDLHFICTWELCRLLKRLRRCGIDTTYSDTRQPSKVTAHSDYVPSNTSYENKRGCRILTRLQGDHYTQKNSLRWSDSNYTPARPSSSPS